MTAFWFILSGIFAFILGVAAMALAQIAGRSDVIQERDHLQSLVNEMADDWLIIYCRSDANAKLLAEKWVGEGGRLEKSQHFCNS